MGSNSDLDIHDPKANSRVLDTFPLTLTSLRAAVIFHSVVEKPSLDSVVEETDSPMSRLLLNDCD